METKLNNAVKTTETAVVQQSGTIHTRSSLREAFKRLTLQEGNTVLLHSSLSKLGWVCGGAVTVIDALLDVLGEEGTLMVPTHTADNSDPSLWQNPPVPEEWWEKIRREAPAFDPAKTPSRRMGSIAEAVRTWPGAKRSSHPLVSFSAIGPKAGYLLQNHHLEGDLGEDSPLARLHDVRGFVLLLGVGHERNTSLHLAEYRAAFPGKRYYTEGCAMLVEGERRWVQFPRLSVDSDDFENIGEAAREGSRAFVNENRVINAQLFRQSELVDFAVQWMNVHRRRTPNT